MKIGALTLFVADLQASKAFYENAFDAEKVFEDENSAVYGFENTLVNLLAEREVPGLIEPLPVGSGARAQYTIWVEDCDAAVAELRRRAVEFLNGPQDRPWGQRTAAFSDPDAHVWEIAQQLA
jgi:catechol 2,3-dioxygenase-like lactoylglutathione lyase family enzyme